MNKSEMLYSYFDGELPSDMEEELFYHISTDAELRQEMNKLMNFNKTLKSKTDFFNPPRHLSAAIFTAVAAKTALAAETASAASAQAASTGANVTAVATTSKSGFFANLFSGFTIPQIALTSAMAGIAIALLGTYSVYHLQTQNSHIDLADKRGKSSEVVGNKSNIPQVIQSESSNSIASKEKNEIGIINKQVKEKGISNKIFTNSYRSDENSETNFADSHPKQNISKNEPHQKASEPAARLLMIDNSKYNEFDFAYNRAKFQAINSENNASENIKYSKAKFALQFYGSQTALLDNQSSDFTSPNQERSIGFAIFYEIDSDLQVGVDYRQEIFHQKFETQTLFGATQYEQQPKFNSFGLMLRYNPIEFASFAPFMQFYVGGNKVGHIERGQIGLRYEFNESISAVVGAEYSLLNYNAEGRSFQSPKLDFSYGVQYQF